MKRVDLIVGHTIRGGNVYGSERATRVDLKVLAAFLNALADEPYDVEATVGAFTVRLFVGQCPACYGRGVVNSGSYREAERRCEACDGTGKEKET